MNNDLNDSLEKMEALSNVIESGATMTPDEQELQARRKKARSVFMSDIRFKESMTSGEFISEDAYGSLDDEKKQDYEMLNVVDEKTGEPMGWVFRFKNYMKPSEDEEQDEEDDSVDMLSEKAAAILSQMRSNDIYPMKEEHSSMSLTSEQYKKMMDSGELVSDEDYKMMDDDAKGAFEAVNVIEEPTGKGMGKCWRRRSPLEMATRRKSEKAADKMDMFESAEEAAARAEVMGCRGTHRAAEMFMPCSSHDEYLKLSKRMEDDAAEANTSPAPAPMPAASGGMGNDGMMKSADSFLCGFQRKAVNSVCDFCTGGCKTHAGVPNLGDIENQVKAAYAGSEIVNSGYSDVEDIFVVDVKRADGSFIEVFLNGYGDELGWLRLDAEAIDSKSAQVINIVTKSEAENTAIKTLENLGVDAKVMSVIVDIFADEDVYVVELDADQKSYDVFVAVDGKVLGYDEYDYENTDEEVKSLEAELQIKRMYSREQREEMSESGEAMEDGSFPIADEADLSNAIQAVGRAKDVDAAKAHIMKRAKELKLEDMVPTEWSSGSEMGNDKKYVDSSIISDMTDFMNMLKDTDLR